MHRIPLLPFADSYVIRTLDRQIERNVLLTLRHQTPGYLRTASC